MQGAALHFGRCWRRVYVCYGRSLFGGGGNLLKAVENLNEELGEAVSSPVLDDHGHFVAVGDIEPIFDEAT